MVDGRKKMHELIDKMIDDQAESVTGVLVLVETVGGANGRVRSLAMKGVIPRESVLLVDLVNQLRAQHQDSE